MSFLTYVQPTYVTSNHQFRVNYSYEERLPEYYRKESLWRIMLEVSIIIMPYFPLQITEDAGFMIKGTLTWIFFDIYELIYDEYTKGIPILRVIVERIQEPEAEWEELVFRILVDLEFDEAMRFWNTLAEKVNAMKRTLSGDIAKIFDEKVALHVEWKE